MIVDSSALIAILDNEPEAAEFLSLLGSRSDLKMSAATLVEASIVADRMRTPQFARRFDQWIQLLQIEIVPFTERQAKIAREAYRDYGRGSGHPARLNFGDCFSYALATDLNEPLLFKGDDFSHTDVTPAVPRSRPHGR